MADETGLEEVRRAPLPDVATPAAFLAAFPVSRETVARLETYAAVLAQWQARINLVAPSTLAQTWHRHLADSAQLLELAPVEALRWLDLGSGAGFPGLVLAILLAGIEDGRARRVTLVESDSRKCAFLAEIVRRTDIARRITVDIVNSRIESASTRDSLKATQVITARALAPLDRLLGYAAPFVGPETVALFPKGRDVRSEIAEARRRWRFDGRLWWSLTDAEARIVEVRQLEARTEG